MKLGTFLEKIKRMKCIFYKNKKNLIISRFNSLNTNLNFSESCQNFNPEVKIIYGRTTGQYRRVEYTPEIFLDKLVEKSIEYYCKFKK